MARKAKAAERQVARAQAGTLRLPTAAAAGVALLIALLLALRSGSSLAGGSGSAVDDGVLRPVLDSFSAEHNASLLWGTYRPGVYFGLRSRSSPSAAVAGLLWAAGGSKSLAQRLRHECEQDTVQRYGFSSHDGVGYAVQPIEDAQNGVSLITSFVKPVDERDSSSAERGSWAVRVSVSPTSTAAVAEEVSLFFYFGVEDEYDAAARAGGANWLGAAPPLAAQTEGGYHVEGSVQGLGRFAALAQARGAGGEPLELSGRGSRGGYLSVRSMLVDELGGGAAKAKGGKASAPRRLSGEVEPASQLLMLQVVARPPFTFELVFAPGGCGGDEGAARCAALQRRMTGAALSELLGAREERYRAQLDSRFGLSAARSLSAAPPSAAAAPLSESSRAFGRAALAAALGSLGYFYGTSTIADADAGGRDALTAAAPLFAVVPSRPFFPRGFLWDDGFHQLLVGVFNPALADDSLAHWLGLMHADGWIPREQILGAEARSRVPAEFLKQHRMHANPPTLLLRIHRLLAQQKRAGATEPLPALFRALLPKLRRWHEWFRSTQAGEIAGSFRWRGRDPHDPRLNALTLSSGLDDYPRAHVASDKERHVDLHCWMAFFSQVLSELCAALGEAELARQYADEHRALLESLLKFHWNPKLQAFCDWGLHANHGSFKPFVVIKCSSNDGASSVEVDSPDPRGNQGWRPNCPPAHPRFLYPLGDGSGGLLTRERFVPRGGLREQFVEHLGYVSLFPLLLRLLPADAPQLGPLLEMLSDEERLWSPYGIRSLSKADRMYERENAPGDAPYWRGPIWINLNYLVLSGLHHYANEQGPQQARAAELYLRLRATLLSNMQAEWERTGYFWEQYDPTSGRGMRTHPFNGWSSLALLALAEVY